MISRSARTFSAPHRDMIALIAGAPVRPAVTDRPLWFYGNGNLKGLASEYFAAIGQPVEGVFWGDEYDTVPRDVRVAVCITSAPYVPIDRRLRKAGFDDVWPVYDVIELHKSDQHPLRNGWYSNSLPMEKAEYIFDNLGDEASRAYYLQFLAWRVMREEWTFFYAPSLGSYLEALFIPEITSIMTDDEVFFDGGAYHGKASERFVQLVNGHYAKVIAVEPDRASLTQLNRNIESLPRTEILDVALSDWDGVARFNDGFGMASRLGNMGNVEVTVRKIDSLDISPTIVMLHLEGGELKALQGAENTLIKQWPIVTAAVYHNEDGIWRTIMWLMNKLEGYKFLFRNYSWCGTGAMVYAIPEER